MKSAAAGAGGLVVIVLAAGGGVLAARDIFTPYFPALACGVGPSLLFLVRSRLQILPLSPPWILSLGLSVVGLSGFFLQSRFNDRLGGSVTFALSASDTTRTTLLFAASSAAVALGAAITASLLNKPQPRGAPFQARLSDRAVALIGVACFIPAIIEIIATGGQLLSRPTHLTEVAGTSLVSVFSGLGTAAAGACGYVASQTRGARRILALLAALTYMTLDFALSSRALALIPVVFAVGVFAARRNRAGTVALAVAGGLAVLLLPLPLYLRGLGVHGLLPYIADLSSFSYADVDWYGSAQNVLIAFPLAGTVAYYVGYLPFNYLLVELNPLPGTLAGWYDISPYVRFDDATPFSAVGEIGNYGPLAVLVLWGTLGTVMALLDARIGHYTRSRHFLIGVALATLSGLILVFALQYNLRSGVRLVIYAVALELGMRIATWLPRRGGRPIDQSPSDRSISERGGAAD